MIKQTPRGAGPNRFRGLYQSSESGVIPPRNAMYKRADKKRARRKKNANHGKRPASGRRRT